MPIMDNPRALAALRTVLEAQLRSTRGIEDHDQRAAVLLAMTLQVTYLLAGEYRAHAHAQTHGDAMRLAIKAILDALCIAEPGVIDLEKDVVLQ